MKFRNQYLASGILCISCVSIGILLTWTSSTLALFASENTTLSRPMTETEISLFGSLSSIGALIATPFLGFLMDKIGRKYLAMGISMVHAVAWSLRIAFHNVEVILFSCVLAGMGNCATLVVAVFIGEYCDESTRGVLTSAPIATSGIGMLISYWIGGTLDYYAVNYICLTISIIGIVLILFLKESPTHLMRKGLEEEAAKSIAFYRNTNITSKEVTEEIESISRSLNTEGNEKCTVISTPEISTQQVLTKWQFIKKSKSTRRAFGVCITITMLTIFQGVSVLQVYTAPLFREAIPTISPTVTTVLYALVTIVVSLLSGYLSDVFGRRMMLLVGSTLGGICCLLLGLQLQVPWGPHWMTAVLIYCYCGSNGLGPGTVPYVLMAEVFLPEIKGIASMLILESVYIAVFIVLYSFNPLVTLIGLPPVFYIFGVVCFVTSIFTFFALPETKGLPVDGIQLLFNKNNDKST